MVLKAGCLYLEQEYRIQIFYMRDDLFCFGLSIRYLCYRILDTISSLISVSEMFSIVSVLFAHVECIMCLILGTSVSSDNNLS